MEHLIRITDAKDALKNELDQIDHVPQWVFDRLSKCLDSIAQIEIDSSMGVDLENKLMNEIKYYRDKCSSYEQTIVKLASRLAERWN